MPGVVFLLCVHGAASHGRIAWPPSRQGGSLEVAGTVCGYHDGGTSVEDGCAWVANGVEISGFPTLLDPDLLTMKDSIANPGDRLNPGKGPWRSPGTAPVTSPCGNDLFHPERDGRDLPPNPTKTTWTSGSIVEVATAVYINHGGGWSFRLCPKTEEPTEECFQHHALSFVGGAVLRFTNGTELQLSARRTIDGRWSRNLIPGRIGQHLLGGSSLLLDSAGAQLEYPMPFDGLTPNTWDFSIVEQLHVPTDTSPGEYLLSWRWDCESSPQVWFSCADVSVSAADDILV